MALVARVDRVNYPFHASDTQGKQLRQLELCFTVADAVAGLSRRHTLSRVCRGL
jgi:hypothetical protein